MRDRLEDVREAGGDLIAVGMGEAWKARALRDEYAVPYPILVDVDRVAYRAAGLRSASVAQLVRPGTWRAVREAKHDGFRQTSNGPHSFQLGGSFVFGPGDQDLYADRPSRIGKEAPIEDLLAAVRRAAQP